ncbi:MAG: PhzF family phenazine biosynthesis protein [Chloroflexi bacterium]|nr:PhzF family phenazine biosynthesis protein [Chloroflexota bacterium]
MPTQIPIYQVDAFADRVFTGNPAAVCPLEEWLPDEVMQAIAAENNLSETAFFVRRPDDEYDLRWFTPKIEVDLCGHATLASGHVVLTKLTPNEEMVAFHTRSGRLTVLRDGDRLEMDFPAQEAPLVIDTALLAAVGSALGKMPSALRVTHTIMAVFDHHSQVASLKPDFAAINQLDIPYVIATAPGDETDFVSRFFAPGAGIDEDPVTGSTHTIMTPYWVSRLGRNPLTARQISQRGGNLWCRLAGDRVIISGYARDYMRGQIEV